ncbi:MupA/Atu3671 family FMN-dependent luciferase-like monooxygenase [Streptomyces sp. NPDC126499]|uniref:MupA/Atu3671 family FMN-dependent luciferase-like monooxygenase n=1 Tax=Streptomyces sp. NPDC126499 TaxID=3155314 RepID=UPI0033324088
MDFSLFYFANDSSEESASGRYGVLLAGARFADRHGFAAVWTPERHFHPFGGTYPNPAVTGAAVAAVTERVAVRAGSVVAPLHHPARIAEEWSVVDNISGGRAGVSFASGWHPVDFSLRPEAFEKRKSVMAETIEQVRALWRGEPLSVTDGVGRPAEIRTFPPPVRGELPVWVTSAGGVETFRAAGELRAGLLTHLLGQDLDELAGKITEYRASHAAATEGERGHVVLMLHTLVGEDRERVRDAVREPMTAYLRSSFHLIAKSMPDIPADFDIDSLDPEDLDFLLERAFDRYFETGGLFGTVEDAARMVDRLRDIGVDEVACLVDFGLPDQQILDGLHHLARLRETVRQGAAR